MSWEQILLIAREVRAIVQWQTPLYFIELRRWGMHIDSVAALIYAVDVIPLIIHM